MNKYTLIPLITAGMFRQHSPVSANTDIKEFIPYIGIAQELHIKKILGEPLMDELRQQVKADALTCENSDLIVQIAPVLSFYTVYLALPFHWASIVNKGVTIRESENSKGVDITDIAQLRSWIKDDAGIAERQLIDFLCRHRSRYPLWRPLENCCGSAVQEGSAGKSYATGFYFPARKRGCGCDNE